MQIIPYFWNLINLHNIIGGIMNIFEHDNLNPFIDDIMGDYVESPECKRRIEEFNKKYFKLRENLLPYEQTLLDRIFMDMEAIDKNFAMEAFRKGVTYSQLK